MLFGWSRGGAIALQIAHRSDYAHLVVRLVLDSPVLNWVKVITANCKRIGTPRNARLLAIPRISAGPLARLAGLPARVPVREFNWVTRAEDLSVPTQILHGSRDDSVPISVSLALAEHRADLAHLETLDAGQTMAWNSNLSAGECVSLRGSQNGLRGKTGIRFATPS